MQVYTAPDSPNWDRMIDATYPHGRAPRRVRADPQDRAPARDDLGAAQRQGDGRVPPRRRHHRHGHAAHRRGLRHHHVAARRRVRLARRASRGTAAPGRRPRHLDLATEEFLRHFTPAQGGGRTSRRTARWRASSSRPATGCSCRTRCATTTPSRSPTPTRSCSTGSRTRTPRSASACTAASARTSPASTSSTCSGRPCDGIPDYRIDHAGKEQYESIGTINGYKHLPATFTPGRREGPPLAEVMADWQARLDAEPAPENLRAAEAGSLMARAIVNAELCQGHTLCNFAAPDVFHLQRRRRSRVRGRRGRAHSGAARAGPHGRARLPRAGHLHRRIVRHSPGCVT